MFSSLSINSLMETAIEASQGAVPMCHWEKTDLAIKPQNAEILSFEI